MAQKLDEAYMTNICKNRPSKVKVWGGGLCAAEAYTPEIMVSEKVTFPLKKKLILSGEKVFWSMFKHRG